MGLSIDSVPSSVDLRLALPKRWLIPRKSHGLEMVSPVRSLLRPRCDQSSSWRATNPSLHLQLGPRTIGDIVAAFELAWNRATPQSDYKPD
jgi:hypothetical protein